MPGNPNKYNKLISSYFNQVNLPILNESKTNPCRPADQSGTKLYF